MKRKQPPGTPEKTLRVFQTSGEELASICADDVGSVQELKRRLDGLCGVPRFRQRLLHEGVVLEDAMSLESSMDVQLVLLNFCEATEEQEEELLVAANSFDAARVERILQRPQSPDTSLEAATPLGEACNNGDIDSVRLLLEARADVDASDNDNDTPLLQATFHGHVHVVDALLEARASTESMQDDDSTPLSVAACEGLESHQEIVRLLLRARADTEARNCDNETPLFVASEFGNESVVSLLLQARANPHAENHIGRTPMLAASTENHAGIVRRLVQALGGTESDGAPLRVAVKYGRVKVLRVLLACRADLEARDPFGRTALSLACRRGKEDNSCDRVVQLLVQARADTNAEDDDGLTPLWHAVRRGTLRQDTLLARLNAREADLGYGDAPNREAVVGPPRPGTSRRLYGEDLQTGEAEAASVLEKAEESQFEIWNFGDLDGSVLFLKFRCAMDLTAAAWLVEGAEVERELDDIGNIWIRGRITRVLDGRQLVDLSYHDGTGEQDVPVADLRPLLPAAFSPPQRQSVSPTKDRGTPAPPPPPPSAPEEELARPSPSPSLTQRIAALRAEAGLLDRNVQTLKERQDSSLAALETANQGVSEAQSGLSQRMNSANECLSDIQGLVAEAKRILADAASNSGFRDLAVLDRLRQSVGRASGTSEVSTIDGHEVIEAWVPAPTSSRATCALCTTLRLSGYPWPNVLETAVEWVRHHQALGFDPILIFIDEPDPSKTSSLASALVESGLSAHLFAEEEMRTGWLQAGLLWEEFGHQVETELSAKQILNCSSALRFCRSCQEPAQWLLSADLDEAVVLDGDVASHFGSIPGNVGQVVYTNHEAVTGADAGSTWFTQVQQFKISPLTKLPFMARRFPDHDEEPQILDHPEGIGENTLAYWRAQNARLAEQFNFRKRAAGASCSYFDGYVRGKAAVRLEAINEASRPGVHRWLELSPGFSTVVTHPGSASILHYLNCGGLDWFEAKYQIRGSEEANRLWFHVLAQERAKMGRAALKELYDDVLSIPQAALDEQVDEGFVSSLGLATPSSQALASAFRGFWGWAAVGLGDGLYVHIPLASGLPDSPGHLPLQQGVDAAQGMGKPVRYLLSPGECCGGPMVLGVETPVLCATVPPSQRGSLVLDVSLASQPTAERGLYVCISKSAESQTSFECMSPISSTSSGWRCRILTHKWSRQSSQVAFWIGCGGAANYEPGPLSHAAGVVFEPLPGAAEVTEDLTFTAELAFELESATLPEGLDVAHSVFYTAYQDIDGQQLSDAGSQGFGGRNLELTYAEVEFAPFCALLQRVAQPQPGETFLDLGSGTGRAVLVAALGFP
ncbi:ANK1, partial [Symbiodinium necroappetens]